MTVPFVTGVIDTTDTSGLGVNTIQDQIQTFVDHQNLQGFINADGDPEAGQEYDAELEAEPVAEQQTTEENTSS